MKTVFNSNEVAHIWASQQQKSGRNSRGSFYFDNNTIFSYGSHFPIATILGHDVLITMRTYSNTTAKQIGKVRGAISHKNVIYCYEVPRTYSQEVTAKSLNQIGTNEKNINQWKANIQRLFTELGNKRNKAENRIIEINRNIEQLQRYCTFFSIKIKDKELNSLLKIAASPNFVEQAREVKAKQDISTARKMKQASKAYDIYLGLWRKFDSEGIKDLPTKIKDLCNFYTNNSNAYTHLRLNTAENRIETSKGVEIPVEIAKRAYIQLNGCFVNNCKELSISVMGYTITETTNDYIKAGCHTIPKSDVSYIANLLNWQ